MKVSIGKFPKKGDRRRVKIEIDNYDTWNLDSTLALIIYPCLLQLKATKHGVPSDFGNVGGESHLGQRSFDFYTDTNDWAFAEKIKEWDETLDKMIWSFEQLIKSDYDSLYHHGTPDYDFEESSTTYLNPITGKTEKTYQLVDKNPDEHWFDHEGSQLHEQRMQEGFELFGKYYRALWD